MIQKLGTTLSCTSSLLLLLFFGDFLYGLVIDYLFGVCLPWLPRLVELGDPRGLSLWSLRRPRPFAMQGLPAQYFFNILLALASQGFANFHGVALHLVVVILLRAFFFSLDVGFPAGSCGT